MKTIFVLLVAALFVSGVFFTGLDNLFATTEENAAEEILKGDDQYIEEQETQSGEDTPIEDSSEEQELQEHEQNYPDEKYQEDRG